VEKYFRNHFHPPIHKQFISGWPKIPVTILLQATKIQFITKFYVGNIIEIKSFFSNLK